MNRARPSRWALPLLAAALAVLPPTRAAMADEPRIERVEILVLRLPDHEQVGVLRPGDILDLEVGQSVRLRLSAIPDRLRPRYPSTRFELESGHRAVTVDRVNQEVGTITLTGVHADGREAVVTYQITDELNVSKELRSGRVRVRVRDRVVTPETSPSPAPGPSFRGLVLFSDADFRGRSQAFDESRVADLGRTGIGRDAASSLRLQPGCRVQLYADSEFRGAMAVVTGDVADLGRTPVGNDRVSSFILDCGGGGGGQPGSPRGLTLYADAGFHGDSQTFTGNAADLNGTRIRPDRASSARVDPGCRAILYDDPGFQGAAVLVDRDIPDFARSPGFRNDAVSSLTVECDRR